MPQIIPAIFTNDVDALHRMLRASEEFAPEVHIDVTDGLFVERRSLPIATVMEAKPGIPVEFHLMVKEPLDAINQIRETSVNTIIVHWETLGEATTALGLLRGHRFTLGLAVNPETPIGGLSPWLAELGHALIMGVPPGQRGGSLLIEIPNKIRELRTMWPGGTISTDGGMNTRTIPAVVGAGADRIIVSTAIWQSTDPRSEYLALQQIANQLTERTTG